MEAFLERIKRLQQNKALILLRHCSSTWQKSFIKSLEEGRSVVDFADPLTREQAVNYTQAFVQGMAKPALLYNLQLVPELLPILAASEAPSGSYIAVTDQAYYLMPKLEETQNVKVLELPLELTSKQPFVPEQNVSQANKDFGGKQPFLPGQSVSQVPKDVLTSILDGGLFGQSAESGEDRKRFYASYIKSVLQHKIMEQTTVSDDIKFYRFLCVAASLTGTVVNYSTLANGVGITAPTAKQWLQFLEGACVVYLVQPLTDVPGKRLMKAPKLYFRDTGVAAHLLQINDQLALMQSVYLKNLMDNYVVNSIRESYLEQGEEPELLFYQDSNYKKISLILRVGNVLHPIIISKDDYSVNKTKKTFALLEGYAAEHGAKLGSGCIIGMGKEAAVLDKDLYYLPAGNL